MLTNLEPSEALSLVLEAGQALDPELVALRQAQGRVLASDLVALVDHPSLDVSAIDGYALRQADVLGASPELPRRLPVVGEIPAGSPYPGSLPPGSALAIYTGGVFPEGADGLIRVEETKRDGDYVAMVGPASRQELRLKGEDFTAGERLLAAGTYLEARALALAAAMGYAELPVVRRPKVAVVITGDELTPPGQVLPPGAVYDSNAPMLEALVRSAGAEPDVFHLADEPNGLRGVLASGDYDLWISSGGVSMGARDYVRAFLEAHGEPVFFRVRMRPGGPLFFARWQDCPFLGLPGNPVSAYTTFLLFARPLLFKLLARRGPAYMELPARADSDLSNATDKWIYLRGEMYYRDEQLYFTPLKSQSSGDLAALALANALAVVPPLGLQAGEWVRIIPLTEDPNFAF